MLQILQRKNPPKWWSWIERIKCKTHAKPGLNTYLLDKYNWGFPPPTKSLLIMMDGNITQSYFHVKSKRTSNKLILWTWSPNKKVSVSVRFARNSVPRSKQGIQEKLQKGRCVWWCGYLSRAWSCRSCRWAPWCRAGGCGGTVVAVALD